MFPKGPRFEPMKVPEVPGPNSYNIPQESALESYKRGAFLEKTDRFSEDKQPILPGPNSKPSSNMNTVRKVSSDHSAIERYNLLQKKVDELEKVHVEGKKAHQVELAKLKQEVQTSQKLATDNSERAEKHKKQNAVLDARLQELKKGAASDQSEIKDLKHKLRIMEMEREKMSSKQPEIVELKKTLATLDTKRKDELKDRDRRIAELEKQLQTEQKKRETVESKVKDSKRIQEEELQSMKAAATEMEARLQEAQEESRVATEKVGQIEHNIGHREHELLEQLEQHRTLLVSVSQQYGALASQSVLSAVHASLKGDHTALQLRQLRLERKLANSEAQAVELTNLFRQVKEDNNMLKSLLNGALEEIAFWANMDTSSPLNATTTDAALAGMDAIGHNLLKDQVELLNIDLLTDKLTSTYYRLKSNELRFASSVFAKECAGAQSIAEQRASDLSSALASHEAIATRVESIQQEKIALQDELRAATMEADNLRAATAILETQVSDLKQEILDTVEHHANSVKKDKEILQRLTSTVQKNRMAEEGLRAEIEQLTTELTEAERFQEAYYSLSDRIGNLLTRNQIAEEEAETIRKFNAEILGHNNPAQRIMYVDRIRRELAEAKHRIACLDREQENIALQNDQLQNELDMYKSVQVPLESKPRANIIRVGRAPLVNLAYSLNASSALQTTALQSQAQSSSGGKTSPHFASSAFGPVLKLNDGDMTTDELI